MRLLLTLALLGTATSPAATQTVDVEVALGAVADYPRAFTDDGCENAVVGLTASGARRLATVVSLELSASVTANPGGQTCVTADLLAPHPLDEPFDRVRYGDHVAGTSLFATNFAAVLEPWPDASISPRARLGMGVVWDKRIPNWLWGVGARYRFGRHYLAADVDRWHLTIERFVDRVIVPSSTMQEEVLSTRRSDEDGRPLVIRVGWGIRVR